MLASLFLQDTLHAAREHAPYVPAILAALIVTLLIARGMSHKVRRARRWKRQRYALPRDGGALLEALAALALCAVWGALILLALTCRDAADVAALLRP